MSFTCLLVYGGQYFIDRQRRGLFIYLFGTVAFLFGISFFITLVGLSFYSLKVYIKIHRYSPLEEKATRIFKEKVIFKFVFKTVHCVRDALHSFICTSFSCPFFVCISMLYWKRCFFYSIVHVGSCFLFN
jgi:hypothetical protein